MSSTVENISANIDSQVNVLGKLLDIVSGYDLELSDEKMIEKTKEDFDNLVETYNTSTTEILKDYYQSTTDSTKKVLHNKFIKAYRACNLVGTLKRLFNNLTKLRKVYEFDDQNIAILIHQFNSTIIDETCENVSSDICPTCNLVYDIEEKTAEFTCKNCGHIEKMYGVVFEDEQFFFQEGQRTKHGKYDPIKHAKFWLDRIQAKESTDIPESVINSVKRCIRRDQLWKHDVTCEVVRSYLKQTKNTEYNNHVALIRKIITGIEPDQLTEHEVRLTYMYFGVSIQVFEKIKDQNKSNCPYHPFFIYKIIEQVLKKSSDSVRRRSILSCIHLQSRDTLIENDKLWFEICDYIPDFVKVATDGGIR